MNKIVKFVERLINPAIQSMQPYHVPDARGLIKLDAMENPYAWPQELKQPWLEALSRVEIHRYPDPGAHKLKERLRRVMAVPPGVSILLGNGSDELIQILALAVSGPERTILAPDPGFAMYRQIASTVNAAFCGVPLDSNDFSLKREATLREIEIRQPALIFIAYPNNPTGNLFDKQVLFEIIRAAEGLVVIDEAYHAFSRDSFMEHIGEFDNLLVMRTLSKSGLAGIRLGYLLGPAPWLEHLEKIRLPYNINTLSQVTTDFILTHNQVLERQARDICAVREKMYAALSRMEGIKTWPSSANFILFRTESGSAEEIHAGLKQQGILIKNLHGGHPLLSNCLRVTAGTDSENDAFLHALSRLL